MKKIAIVIILAVAAGGYFFVFNQNSIPTCDSAEVQVSSLVKKILGQTSSQKSIKFEVVDMQETKVYEHSRVCKAQLDFEDGTDTSISYAVERNKLGKTEVRIIPGG
jgi:hypothetical protein